MSFLINILASKENFTKIQKFKNAVVEKIVFVFRAKDDCFVGAFEKNHSHAPTKKKSFCALNTKITFH
jgi:hypothetical protein